MKNKNLVKKLWCDQRLNSFCFCKLTQLYWKIERVWGLFGSNLVWNCKKWSFCIIAWSYHWGWPQAAEYCVISALQMMKREAEVIILLFLLIQSDKEEFRPPKSHSTIWVSTLAAGLLVATIMHECKCNSNAFPLSCNECARLKPSYEALHRLEHFHRVNHVLLPIVSLCTIWFESILNMIWNAEDVIFPGLSSKLKLCFEKQSK